MAAGRIDLVAKSDTIIYIMELKMNDEGGVMSATRQFATRHYADSYAASDKKVICLALEFGKESRGLERWAVI